MMGMVINGIDGNGGNDGDCDQDGVDNNVKWCW